MKYGEPVVVIRKKDLDKLIEAYDALSNDWENEVVQCGKCGAIHRGDCICPECGNDPDDDEYPFKEVDLNIEILERL